MKKVTAFVGSARKMDTYNAASRLLDDLRSRGGVETEIVRLHDYEIGICRGCKICFSRGEEFCPVKDDRDALIAKLTASDGVVLATPNYSFQVSGVMKLFLDRLGFVFHRPRFFGKAFTSIVVQGVYRGRQIERYLDFVGKGLGFNTVRGTVFTVLEPITEKEKRQRERALADQGRRFYERMTGPAYPAPALIMLMGFRMGRTSMKLELDENSCDCRYYRDRGWFESDYFYPTKLGPVKKAVGRLSESFQARKTRARNH